MLLRKLSETGFEPVVVAGSFLAAAETVAAVGTAVAVETAAEVGTVAVVETAVEVVVSEQVELIACVGCSLRSQHEI